MDVVRTKLEQNKELRLLALVGMKQPRDLLRESANSPHPPTPSPKEGEGKPEIGNNGDFVVGCQVPLPTWERDLG
ncbi:MAG: hypothetical protein BJG00_009890 [Limnothrix sp. CACIAM 69d]|nr:MAG: hypothetical protein BJG00_009890 [Limnothrix sp. CACIAM 69d]